MISKTSEKQRAIALRKRGSSYREILKEIPVAKSTLSLWLRSVGLSKRQQQRLTERRRLAGLRGAQTRREQRIERTRQIVESAKKEIRRVSVNELWLMGIMLYWAEGSKERIPGKSTNVKFSNSDPLMISLFREWLYRFHSVSPNQIRYELYIHEKADWGSAKKFWCKELRIFPRQIHVYFKRHNPKPRRKNIGEEYHGLIRIEVPGTSYLVRKITGWVESICKYCGVV